MNMVWVWERVGGDGNVGKGGAEANKYIELSAESVKRRLSKLKLHNIKV